jgi:hypothetical protein
MRPTVRRAAEAHPAAYPRRGRPHPRFVNSTDDAMTPADRVSVALLWPTARLIWSSAFGYRPLMGRKTIVAASGSIVTRKRPRKSIPRMPRNRSSSVRSRTTAARLEATCPPTRSSRTTTTGSVATPPLAKAIRLAAPGFKARRRAVTVALLRRVKAEPVSTRKSKSCPLTRAGTRSTPPWARWPGIRLPGPKAHPESFGDGLPSEEHVEAFLRMRGAVRPLSFFEAATISRVQDDVSLNGNIAAITAPHSQRYPFVAVLPAGCRDEHEATIPNASAGSQFRTTRRRGLLRLPDVNGNRQMNTSPNTRSVGVVDRVFGRVVAHELLVSRAAPLIGPQTVSVPAHGAGIVRTAGTVNARSTPASSARRQLRIAASAANAAVTLAT